MNLVRGIAALCLVVTLGGCDFGQHWLAAADGDQVVRASSGDRFYLTLETDPLQGDRWSATCDDSDVTVSLDRREEKTKAEIRVHRGFDGPATVTFTRRRNHETQPKRFSVVLYRRTGDVAFWE